MTFKFLNRNKKFPKRVVILGSTGIISTNLQRILKKKNIKFISVGRSKFDLKSKKTIKKLRKKIKKRDSIIFIAAEAPVKNSEMFLNNIKICETVWCFLKVTFLHDKQSVDKFATFDQVVMLRFIHCKNVNTLSAAQ